MSEFFVIENNQVVPSVDLLATPEFSDIWEADTSPDKHEALKGFKFIYHAYWEGGVTAGIRDEDREKYAWEMVFKTPYVKLEDGLFPPAIERILLIQENAFPSYRLYKAAKTGFEKLEAFLSGIDFNERTSRDALLYTPSMVTNTIKELGPLAESLRKLRGQLELDGLTAKTRANRPTNHFEI